MADQKCYDAFRYGQEKEAIVRLRKMKGDPREMKYWYNTTILHFAAYRGWFEALQLLITEYDFDPDCRNDYDTSPLHWSSEYGHPDIVKYLITECNCDPNCKNWNNETPLDLAKHPQDITRHEGHDRVIEYLESLSTSVQNTGLPEDIPKLTQNKSTLLPKFFGLYHYECGDIDIYMLVTNNVLSCSLKYNFKFNLNGFKRKALSDEQAKKSPTYKDNEFKQLLPKQGTRLPVPSRTKTQEKFSIINVDALPRDDEAAPYYREGYIPGRTEQGGILLCLGIIDILRTYKLKRNLQHGLKSVDDDHLSEYYSETFQTSMKSTVFRKESAVFEDLLEKARAEGVVTTKWSNFAVFGASGVGKTSLLDLLLMKPPEYLHNSTPAVRVPEVGITDSDSSSDETVDDNLETRVIIADESDKKCNWKIATVETMKSDLAKALRSHVQLPSNRPKIEELPDKESSDEELWESDESEDDDVLLTNVKTQKTTPLKRFAKLPVPSADTTKELVSLISTLGELEITDRLYEAHWIYAIDTGGQAAFLDIAPALLRYHSVNIVAFKLIEKLTDLANFYYSIGGRRVGMGEKRQVSTLNLVKSFIHSKSELKLPELEGIGNIQHEGKPAFLVIATHYDEYLKRLLESLPKGDEKRVQIEKLLQDWSDKCPKQLKESDKKRTSNQIEETLEQKNEYLYDELNHYKDVIVDYNTTKEEVIFPVNTRCRKRISPKNSSNHI